MPVFGFITLTEEIKKNIVLSGHILEKLKIGIIFGFPVSNAILENLGDGPDLLYLHNYRQVNFLLDRTALLLTAFLEKNAFFSVPVPASQITDWENQRAHLSHKLFAVLAGIGWLGRNNLVVHPVYGSRLRFATVLTEVSLHVKNNPVPFNCRDCSACIERCPAGAIKQRPVDFDHIKCYEKIKVLTRERKISQYICGLCIKACRPL